MIYVVGLIHRAEPDKCGACQNHIFGSKKDAIAYRQMLKLTQGYVYDPDDTTKALRSYGDINEQFEYVD